MRAYLIEALADQEDMRSSDVFVWFHPGLTKQLPKTHPVSIHVQAMALQ